MFRKCTTLDKRCGAVTDEVVAGTAVELLKPKKNMPVPYCSTRQQP